MGGLFFLIFDKTLLMKNFCFLTLTFLYTFPLYSQSAEQVIRAAMAEQQEAWNSGDIDSFMTHYWNSPNLKFVTKNGVTMGWEGTLENYKRSYPDQDAMGALQFKLEEVRSLSGSAVFVIGSWQLSYTGQEPVGGYFNLLWELKEGKWVITVDHTSG